MGKKQGFPGIFRKNPENPGSSAFVPLAQGRSGQPEKFPRPFPGPPDQGVLAEKTAQGQGGPASSPGEKHQKSRFHGPISPVRPVFRRPPAPARPPPPTGQTGGQGREPGLIGLGGKALGPRIAGGNHRPGVHTQASHQGRQPRSTMAHPQIQGPLGKPHPVGGGGIGRFQGCLGWGPGLGFRGRRQAGAPSPGKRWQGRGGGWPAHRLGERREKGRGGHGQGTGLPAPPWARPSPGP